MGLQCKPYGKLKSNFRKMENELNKAKLAEKRNNAKTVKSEKNK